jgi:hypothetical protein
MIHDGGSSVLLITFCPWCGSRLPVSIRDEVLENDGSIAVAVDDPASQV